MRPLAVCWRRAEPQLLLMVIASALEFHGQEGSDVVENCSHLPRLACKVTGKRPGGICRTFRRTRGSIMNVTLVISKILIIIGGLNWGLVGLFNFNLVDSIFGVGSVMSKVVYILVGIAALVAILDFVPRDRAGRSQV